MSEIQRLYRQIKDLEMENRKLNFANAKLTIPAGTFLFVCSVAEKSIPLSILALGLVACGGYQISLGNNIEKMKEKNQDAYYEKVRQMHFYSHQYLRLAFNELRHEQDPKQRRQIMNAIRWMKKNDAFRNADKKALIGLTGRKRKGLARGLKNLRQQTGHLSREEYIIQRENILSYY